jgi:carbonic anhydrase/acetyltransferase-like protein (isoleucine patch superfamily)
MTLYSYEGIAPTLPDDNDYWVAPNAQVMGKVIINSGVSVWFGVVARGDNEPITIGEGSNIQESTVMHTDMGFPLTIGRNCTIGHTAIVHGCTIGDNTLIGMGATVMNGTKVGKNCLVGAGALMPPGKEYPDGSLIVGSPAVVKRQLTAPEIAGLEEAAISYQKRMRQFREGLVEITASETGN